MAQQRSTDLAEWAEEHTWKAERALMDIVLIEVEVTERKSHWCRSEIRHLWQTCSDTGSVSKREFPLDSEALQVCLLVSEALHVCLLEGQVS